MSEHTLQIGRSGVEELTTLLQGLGVSVEPAGVVRNFGIDEETVRLVATVSPAVASVVGGAVWAFVRLRANQSVKVGDTELRGLSVEAIVKILAALKDK